MSDFVREYRQNEARIGRIKRGVTVCPYCHKEKKIRSEKDLMIYTNHLLEENILAVENVSMALEDLKTVRFKTGPYQKYLN